MADIARWKVPQKFFILNCCYGNWNKLSSYYFSQRDDDFVLGHISTDETACLSQRGQQFFI